MKALQAGALYFAIVFGAGFVLGTIRTLWIVPRLGVRMAELAETPFMLAVSIAAAAWVVRRVGVPHVPSSLLAVGVVALTLLLLTEFTLMLRLRGLSLRQYLASRDPVSGNVYYAMLVLFALLPLLVARK